MSLETPRTPNEMPRYFLQLSMFSFSSDNQEEVRTLEGLRGREEERESGREEEREEWEEETRDHSAEGREKVWPEQCKHRETR
ncbi:hypothetical protein E2C01_101941 [Portunus trituberculatus]|uniref:Uncharacterized protein n=1 Tax=Portunus trituberculatus TaxID=210409 RepID=A0A5B7KG35_PORTR|nr:hypothetical protein [Portunus trituberculatus]